MTKKDKGEKVEKLLGKTVGFLPEIASVFADLVTADPADRPKFAQRLHELEAEADERYIKLVHRTADTFITPYDREDIYLMIESLDDVVDCLDQSGSLIVELPIDDLPESVVKASELLIDMSGYAAEAIDLIKKPKKLEETLLALGHAENELDVCYRATFKAGVDSADPMYALKLLELAKEIEEAATSLEEFARALGVTAIKET